MSRPTPTHARKGTGRGWGISVGAAICYATVVVLGKYVDHGTLPFVLLVVRFGGQALVLSVVLVALRRPLLPERTERVPLLVVGIVAFGGEAALYFSALNHGNAAAVTLLFYTYPAWTMFGRILSEHKRPTRELGSALLFSFTGVAIMTTGRPLPQVDGTGALMALSAGALYAAYLLGSERYSRVSEPLPAAVWVSVGACATNLVLWALWGFSGAPRPPGALAAVILFSTLTVAGVMVAIRRIGPVRHSIIATIGPPAAAVLGFVFLGEGLTGATVVGGALILAAAVIAALD